MPMRSSSLFDRALGTLLSAAPAAAPTRSHAPAVGIQSRRWLTSPEGPVQLGFYTERQSVHLGYMDQLSADQVGLAASGSLLGARIFAGAGMERIHTDTFHPDLPGTRRVFDATTGVYGNPAVTGPAGYYHVDYAPHLTLGAGYELGALQIGTGLSFGVSPSVSLTAELPLF